MAEKIQSARGAIKGTGKDLIGIGNNKVSNLLMDKEKRGVFNAANTSGLDNKQL